MTPTPWRTIGDDDSGAAYRIAPAPESEGDTVDLSGTLENAWTPNGEVGYRISSLGNVSLSINVGHSGGPSDDPILTLPAPARPTSPFSQGGLEVGVDGVVRPDSETEFLGIGFGSLTAYPGPNPLEPELASVAAPESSAKYRLEDDGAVVRLGGSLIYVPGLTDTSSEPAFVLPFALDGDQSFAGYCNGNADGGIYLNDSGPLDGITFAIAPGAVSTPAPPGVYCSAGDLREAIGLPSDDVEALSDQAAAKLIRRAERLVDVYLGVRGTYTTGPSAGRKVAQADVAEWIWAEVGEATASIGAMIFTDPERFDRQYGSISGPDFSVSDVRSSPLGLEALAILDGTGLCRRTARGHA